MFITVLLHRTLFEALLDIEDEELVLVRCTLAMTLRRQRNCELSLTLFVAVTLSQLPFLFQSVNTHEPRYKGRAEPGETIQQLAPGLLLP